MNIAIEVLLTLCKIFYYILEALYRIFIPPPAKTIRGQVALVTGGGRGIGQGIALELAKHGAKIAVLDINEASANETALQITESGGTARGYRCDVTKVKEVSEVVMKVCKEIGDVDVLVNNAGVLNCKTILDLSEAEIRRTLEINTIAQFWTVKEVLPSMIARKRGHIIIICSMAGKESSGLMTDYGTSKFGAHGFGETLYADLDYMKTTGINVTTVYPMYVMTRLVTDISDRVTAKSRLPSHFVTVENVATSVVDGMRRNRRYVYIPKEMVFTNLITLLPFQLRIALRKRVGAGFQENTKQE